MVQRDASRWGEIVNLLGTSRVVRASGCGGADGDAILLDEKRVLPCTALLEASTASTASIWGAREARRERRRGDRQAPALGGGAQGPESVRAAVSDVVSVLTHM